MDYDAEVRIGNVFSGYDEQKPSDSTFLSSVNHTIDNPLSDANR